MSHQPLCEHPNIVQLKGISFIDNSDEDLYPLLIVEPACRDFPDLTRLTYSRSENFAPDLAAGLMSDIADGISVLHVYGVIHGDVKPDNVLIFPAADRPHGLTVKVCDFGFSGSRFSEDNPRGSTPAWAAPECLPNAPVLFRKYRNEEVQDIYSFGLVAAFVLLRRLPTKLRDTKTSEVIANDLQHLTSDYPWLHRFLNILIECLEYDPSQRLSSLSEIRNSIL